MIRDGYSKNYMEAARSMWERCVVTYLERQGTSMYNPAYGKALLDDMFSVSSNSETWKNNMLRWVRFLDDVLELGYIRARRDSSSQTFMLNTYMGEHIKKFLQIQKDLGRAPSSVETYMRGLCRFHNFCQQRGVSNTCDINLDVIRSYVSSHSRVRITCVRLFLDYAFRQGWTDKNLKFLMELCPKKEIQKLPSVYSEQEITIIEESVNRYSDVGKRNYAILLLATRYGLRASDIANLKFSNLRWEDNEIELIQCKTGKKLVLPLLNDVGNAIIDYLKQVRRDVKSPYVFLRMSPPYEMELSPHRVSGILQRTIVNSGINTSRRKHGGHSMRHSLATKLLQSGEMLSTISGILGHSSTQSTQKYISIDVIGLMKSALPVPMIKESFYK